MSLEPNLKFRGEKFITSTSIKGLRSLSIAAALLVRVVLTAFAFFIFSFAAQSINAATITVNSLSDAAAADGQCTLREAMANAEADNQSGSTECPAGAGADTINISVAGTINLLAFLPDITSDMTINGLGAATTMVRRDSGAATNFRIFFIAPGTAVISNMTVRDEKTKQSSQTPTTAKAERQPKLEIGFNFFRGELFL